jgi:NitT/TauT family transport system substrate-binding protein
MNVIGGILGGLLTLSAAIAGANAQEKLIHVGTAKGVGAATTIIGIEKGYFREFGITVDLQDLDSAANVMTLLAQGQLQLVEGGITVGYFNALERGLPITIIGDRVSTPLNHKLLVRADLADKITGISQLKGRSIASNGAGTVTTYEVGKILKSAGIGIGDVDIKILSFVQMGIALTNGAVDAALVIQPWASQYVEKGIARIIADPDDYADPKPLTIAVNLVNTDWANSNKQLLRDYFVAYQRSAYEYCQAYHGGANRKEVVDMLVRRGIEDRPEVLNRYPWPARNANGRINEASLLDMQKYYIGEKLVAREQPLEKLVNYEYVDYATSKLGPFKLENNASKLAGCR